MHLCQHSNVPESNVINENVDTTTNYIYNTMIQCVKNLKPISMEETIIREKIFFLFDIWGLKSVLMQRNFFAFLDDSDHV